MFLCGIVMVSAQIHKNNLIIDGSFDERNDLECHHPNDVPTYTRYWYRSLNSPDFFVKGCPYIRDILSGSFWSVHKTRSYMGFAAVARYTDTLAVEALGVELKEPLKARTFYYFEAEIEDKGITKGHPYPLQNCPITPAKKIGVTFSRDSVLDHAQYVDPYITFDDTAINSYAHNDWKLYSDCFQAKGGEKHMGVGWLQRTFQMAPPCIPVDPYGLYYLAYAYIDEVRVLEIADVLRDTVGFCIREFEVTYDLRNLIAEVMVLGDI